MQCITLAKVEWRSAERARTSRSLLGARRPAQTEEVHRPISDLDAAEALDRQTVWPTHRIRCFLQAQGGQRASSSR